MTRVKVRVEGFEEIKGKISESQARKFLDDTGKFLVKNIAGETRSGKQLIEGKGSKAQKPLADSTKETRKRLEKLNKTHPAYQSNRSNLTFTGQLIDALTHLVNTSKGSISIFIEDSVRKPYRTSSGKRKTKKKGSSRGALTNSEVAEYLEDMDREFVAINKNLEDRITKRLNTFLTQQLSKLVKTRRG